MEETWYVRMQHGALFTWISPVPALPSASTPTPGLCPDSEYPPFRRVLGEKEQIASLPLYVVWAWWTLSPSGSPCSPQPPGHWALVAGH